MIPGGVLAVIGASDCERLGTGLIAQPFNTWTSVAYLLAGGWIIARRRRWGLDPSAVVFGALVAANGLGSIAYHAAVDASGRWLHDLSLLGALGFVAGWQAGQAPSRRARAAPGVGPRSPRRGARGDGRGPGPGARRHGRGRGRARGRRPRRLRGPAHPHPGPPSVVRPALRPRRRVRGRRVPPRADRVPGLPPRRGLPVARRVARGDRGPGRRVGLRRAEPPAAGRRCDAGPGSTARSPRSRGSSSTGSSARSRSRAVTASRSTAR